MNINHRSTQQGIADNAEDRHHLFLCRSVPIGNRKSNKFNPAIFARNHPVNHGRIFIENNAVVRVFIGLLKIDNHPNASGN